MKINILFDDPTVTVITPTIGAKTLVDAVRSVRDQTYSKVKHYVVCDGYQYHMTAHEVLDEAGLTDLPNFQSTCLYENVGANGFYGHRIYAAFPHLINSDYIFFLDEDNWYEPNHVETLVEVLKKGNEFAHSLRNIYDKDGKFVCQDNCESLGKWPIYFSHDNPQYLVDTSSFAFNREFLIQVSNLWHSGWGGDRRFLYAVKDKVQWDGSGKYTLNYRLDGNPGSVDEAFFMKGNDEQAERYKGEFPWVKI